MGKGLRVHLRLNETDRDLCRWRHSIRCNMLTSYVSQITSYEWIVELCQKANQLGYRIMLHPEHEEYGYTWHLHILDGTKKLNYIHVQVTKVIYELLQRLFG